MVFEGGCCAGCAERQVAVLDDFGDDGPPADPWGDVPDELLERAPREEGPETEEVPDFGDDPEAARAREMYDRMAKERQKGHGKTAPGRSKTLPANLPEVKADARDQPGKVFNGNGHANGKAEKKAPPEEPRDDADFFLTDVGNCERLIRAYGKDLLYCHAWKRWLVWDGRRWRIDDTGAAKMLAKKTAKAIFAQAKKRIDHLAKLAEDGDEEAAAALARLKKVLDWGLKSQAAPRINAMLELAQSEVPVTPDQLDQDPMALNVLNGTIDLRTGLLWPHRREDMLTKLAPVEFDDDATCPVWEASVARIMDDRSHLVAYLQRVLGYALTAMVVEQVLLILWGTGANGKSTLINAVLDMLGEDYAGKASRDLLLAAKSDRHPTTIAWLHGKRLVVAMETAEGAKLDETTAKELTGGDKILARRMKEDYWQFSPTHKLAMVTNHKPTVKGTDHAVWRRLRLIPFTVTIPDERQDKELGRKLRAELPGILAWCLRGLADWQRAGMQEPEEVLVATKEYRSSQDLLATFLGEVCITGPDYRVRAGELYGRYREWCKAAGENEVSQRRFGEAIRERGFEVYASNGTWYRGIMIRIEATDKFVEADGRTEGWNQVSG